MRGGEHPFILFSRRRRHRQLGIVTGSILKVGGIEIDADKRCIRHKGDEVHVTRKEYEVLSELARHAGRVLTHSHLLDNLGAGSRERCRVPTRCDPSHSAEGENDASDPRLIRNEPGIGYRLDAEPSA
jgi:two-component system KDP operon response regulator KdpE